VAAGGVAARVVADFDNDGRADVATFSGILEVRLATSASAFTLALSTFVASGGSLAGGDADGDGDVDLVVAPTPVSNQAGTTPQAARLYLNDGTGGFAFFAGSNLPAGNGLAVAMADMDSDGDADVVLSTSTGFGVAANVGGAVFAAPVATVVAGAAGSFIAPAIRVAELNGDGLRDVVFLTGASTATAYLGVPAGYVAGPVYAAAGSIADLVAVDLESDGVHELVLATVLGLEIARVVGGAAAVQLAFHRMNPIRLAAGDLDSDGDVDVAIEARATGSTNTTTFNGRLLRLLLNDGQGGTTLLQPPLPPQELVGPAVAGDFDNDGDLDLVGIARDGTTATAVALARNDGTGVFAWERPLCPTCPGFSTAAANGAALDIDLDGDLDYALALPNNGVSGAILPLLNQGAAGFSAGAPVAVAVHPGIVVAADVDGDGDRDLVVTEATTLGAQLLRNVAGVLAAPVGLSAPQCTDVAAVDADQDGDVDLVVAGATSRLLLNDGTGAFAQNPAFPSHNGIRTSAWDVDFDGKPEVFLDGKLYQRGTTGAWTLLVDVPTGTAPGAGAWEFAAVDFDQSGVVDTFVGSSTLHWAQGPGVISSIVLPVPFPSNGEAPVVADFDRDGDLDLLGPDGNLLANRARHLTLDGAVRPGRSWRVVLRGAPGGAAFLFASAPPAFGALPLAPFGTLFVDPAAPLLLAAGTLGADGAYVASDFLPSTASALVGLPFVLQGLVDTVVGPGLTNARRSSIAGY
jgi:hypothetical protein